MNECIQSSVSFTDLVTPDDRMIVMEEGDRIESELAAIVSLDECCLNGLVGCIEEPLPEEPLSGFYDPETMICELTGYMNSVQYKTPESMEIVMPSYGGSGPFTME